MTRFTKRQSQVEGNSLLTTTQLASGNHGRETGWAQIRASLDYSGLRGKLKPQTRLECRP